MSFIIIRQTSPAFSLAPPPPPPHHRRRLQRHSTTATELTTNSGPSLTELYWMAKSEANIALVPSRALIYSIRLGNKIKVFSLLCATDKTIKASTMNGCCYCYCCSVDLQLEDRAPSDGFGWKRWRTLQEAAGVTLSAQCRKSAEISVAKLALGSHSHPVAMPSWKAPERWLCFSGSAAPVHLRLSNLNGSLLLIALQFTARHTNLALEMVTYLKRPITCSQSKFTLSLSLSLEHKQFL